MLTLETFVRVLLLLHKNMPIENFDKLASALSSNSELARNLHELQTLINVHELNMSVSVLLIICFTLFWVIFDQNRFCRSKKKVLLEKHQLTGTCPFNLSLNCTLFASILFFLFNPKVDTCW